MFDTGSSIRNIRGSAAVSAVLDGGDGSNGPEVGVAGRKVALQFVYFLECDGKIKIGVTRNLKQRMASLKTAASSKIELIAAVEGGADVERALHRKLQPHRLEGEWFRDCAEVRVAIQNCLNNFRGVDVEASPKGKFKTFTAVARLIWPIRTAQKLAQIAGTNERSAKRWLAGEFEPPPVVFLAIFAECLKREGE